MREPTRSFSPHENGPSATAAQPQTFGFLKPKAEGPPMASPTRTNPDVALSFGGLGSKKGSIRWTFGQQTGPALKPVAARPDRRADRTKRGRAALTAGPMATEGEVPMLLKPTRLGLSIAAVFAAMPAYAALAVVVLGRVA